MLKNSYKFYKDESKQRLLKSRMARYQRQLDLNEKNFPYLLPILRQYVITQIELEDAERQFAEGGGYMNADNHKIDTLTKLKKENRETLESIFRVKTFLKPKTKTDILHMIRRAIAPGEEILIEQAQQDGADTINVGWIPKNFRKPNPDDSGERCHGRMKP